MQFAPRRNALSIEERLAKWSISLLACSIVLFAALFAFAYTVVVHSISFFIASACLCIYAGQFYFLDRIGRHGPLRRIHIWALSLLGHLVLFGVVLWLVVEPSLALALLIPETASGLLHLAGISYAFTSR